MIHTQCPRCHNDIPEDRTSAGLTICSCGWSSSNQHASNEEKVNKQITVSIVVMALALVVGFIHAVNWDVYSFEILPLKAAQWSGLASADSHQRIGVICEARKKHECAATQYKQAYLKDNTKLEDLAKAGSIYARLGESQKAMDIYHSYFAANGKNDDAAYQYAKVLGDAGNVKESTKYFKFVLKSKPKTLQVTVARAYVDMLVKNKQLAKARKEIKRFRRQSTSAQYFLKDEMKEIKRGLASVK